MIPQEPSVDVSKHGVSHFVKCGTFVPHKIISKKQDICSSPAQFQSFTCKSPAHNERIWVILKSSDFPVFLLTQSGIKKRVQVIEPELFWLKYLTPRATVGSSKNDSFWQHLIEKIRKKRYFHLHITCTWFFFYLNFQFLKCIANTMRDI